MWINYQELVKRYVVISLPFAVEGKAPTKQLLLLEWLVQIIQLFPLLEKYDNAVLAILYIF